MPTAKSVRPRVFIGHGRAPVWRDLKDHLQDHHGIVVETFETRPRAGLTVSDVLAQILSMNNMAFLVMAREDETANGEWRARQNVVHEAGLFQGRYGFGRAIAVVEEGCTTFSNMIGIQQLRYTATIREVFGEAVATIRREFPRQAP